MSKRSYFVSSGCFRKQKNEVAGTGNITSRNTTMVNHAGKHSVYTAFLMFIIVGTYSRRVNVSGEVTTWPRAVNIY